MPGSVHVVEPVLDKANKAKILIYIQSWLDIQLPSLYRSTLKQHPEQVKNKTPSHIKIGRCWGEKEKSNGFCLTKLAFSYSNKNHMCTYTLSP